MVNRARRNRFRRGGRSMVRPATRLRPAVNRISRTPPSISMNSNSCTLWVRTEDPVTNPSFHKTLNISGLIDDNFFKIFGQWRIKRINVWFIPEAAITAVGTRAMAVVDAGAVSVAKVDFATVSALPGSDIRRMYQTLACAWFPTEPADRNWRAVTDTDAVASVFMSGSNDSSKTGVLLMDIHVSFRGLYSAAASELAPPSPMV